MQFRIFDNSSSFSETRSISFVITEYGVAKVVTNLMYSNSSWHFSFKAALCQGIKPDKKSAMLLGPGMYFTLYTNDCRRSTQRSIRAGGFDFDENIYSKGL